MLGSSLSTRACRCLLPPPAAVGVMRNREMRSRRALVCLLGCDRSRGEGEMLCYWMVLAKGDGASISCFLACRGGIESTTWRRLEQEEQREIDTQRGPWHLCHGSFYLLNLSIHKYRIFRKSLHHEHFYLLNLSMQKYIYLEIRWALELISCSVIVHNSFWVL